MGKCKKRNMAKANDTFFMTREAAVNNVFKMIEEINADKKAKRKSNRKNNSKKDFDFKEALSTISLFGLSAEELSEAGVAYENLKALGSIINN